MDYEVTISDSGNYVRVQVLSDISADVATRFARDAFKLGERNSICKLLVDERGVQSLSSVYDKYSFAHGHGKALGLNHSWRIAVLKNRDNTKVDFMETVMANAGFLFRTFIDGDNAVAWLEENRTRQKRTEGEA